MNDEWDSYGIAVFQGRRGSVIRSSAGVSFTDIDAGRLRMFVLAVLWRMSVSLHPAYRNAQLPVGTARDLRAVLQCRGRLRSGKLQVSLQRLHDTTQGGFSRDQFRDMVMSPFVRSNEGYNAIGFAMFGFVATVYVPALPPRLRRSMPLVGSSESIVFAPYLEFTEFPELFKLGVITLHKASTGLSSLKGQ